MNPFVKIKIKMPDFIVPKGCSEGVLWGLRCGMGFSGIYWQTTIILGFKSKIDTKGVEAIPLEHPSMESSKGVPVGTSWPMGQSEIIKKGLS